MAGLQRSEISFRRQGSSGLVWDDKLFSGELKPTKPEDEEEEDKVKAESGEPKPKKTVQRSRSNGGQAYRSMNVAPAVEPPSPKVSGCGVCGMFGKPNTAQKRKGRSRKS